MGKPLSRPGCFRKSSCCLEKHGAGDRGMGGRDGGIEGGYGDGYVPQRSIYDTMCINQQIDNHHHHHHHHGGSIRQDGGGDGFSYSASSSLRVVRSPGDMFDMQPRSLTPNPSFVRRLDERAIYDSLKLAAQDVDGGSCHSPGHFNRSISPSVSSFSAPGVSSSLSKKHHHHHHHHHGESTKSRDGRQSWKGLTPQKHLECVELTTNDMIDRGGGGYLNPGHYVHQGGQSSSLTSPLISPFSGSPLSSGYHTPVFFSPGKPLPSQSQSLRCSPPQAIHPRHFSQTQSLRMSPPQELRRSPYRAPLVQLSAHDLEQDMRDRGGWGRSERDWEREKEREMERGWAQREWERERERGRLERERARERERRETTFGTFGYSRPVPLHSDSVFLEHEQVLDTTPLLLPQPSPSPSPSPNAAPRMGTGAVGRNRAGSRVGSESVSGHIGTKFDNGSGMALVDSKSGCGARLVSEVGNMSEAEIRAGFQDRNHPENWNKHDGGARVSVRNGCETRMGSQVKTRAGGRDLEGRVQSGIQMEMAHNVNKVVQRGGIRNEARDIDQPNHIPECFTSNVANVETRAMTGDNEVKMETEAEAEAPRSRHDEKEPTEEATEDTDIDPYKGSRAEATPEVELNVSPASEHVTEQHIEVNDDLVPQSDTETIIDSKASVIATDKAEADVVVDDKKVQQNTVDTDKPLSTQKGSKSQKSKSSKSLSSSKSSSRTRPGTATGMRPGAVSPRPNRGLPELESTGPTEGIEFTWPRRIMVRKRTVRQGGALHNLPILPPLPSVLSALEKRRPLGIFHPRTGHFSENPLIIPGDPISFVGRCSLKEPSNQDASQIASLVGRASLKEQNLEHWRVCREQDDLKRSKSKEKQGLPRMEKSEKGVKRHEEEKRKRDKNQPPVGKENVSVTVTVSKCQNEITSQTENVEKALANQQGNLEIKTEGYGHMKKKNIDIREIEKETFFETVEQDVVEANFSKGQVVIGEVGTTGVPQEGESWDAVLDMVNTLWDDGWEKRGTGGDDTDSLPGSLQRWPLLRPPVGFGGSHPPSSAASELSLTELERRARELDSDLEHLDLSQPNRDSQDLFQTATETQKERGDMYQTHPGPQREKGALFTGVVSRSQVSLELSAMVLSATNPDRSPAGWTGKSGAETLGTNSTKEDSSPDSNLTLESDSSGVFLSLSNQSQEETGSDSDQPISGSDLGSSTTSLEKDGDEVGTKEWGREESSEMQWCYPSLLNTSTHEDMEGEQHEDMHGKIRVEELKGKEDTNAGRFSTSSPHPSQDRQPRRKVTIMHTDSGLSPLKKPIRRLIDPLHKPVRTSGLDCGDIDPYVQPDSFVYLAVSAGPGAFGEIRTDMEAFTHHIKHAESRKTQVERDPKLAHLLPDKPEEGDFLCTDSFVYLAAPDCLLLGPEGGTRYSGRESDSESSDSGPVDLSGPGCEMVAGDSDWDSDLSDSDPSRPSRISGSSSRSNTAARAKRLPPEPEWDTFKVNMEPEAQGALFMEQDNRKPLTTSTTGPSDISTGSVSTSENRPTTPEQQLTKKVTWQFKPAQRSVCTGSRKEKDKEMASFARLADLEGDSHGHPSPSSSSSSSTTSSD